MKMETRELEILLNSLYKHVREKEKTRLLKEELYILTGRMGFDSLREARESYVRKQMIKLELTEYSEDNPKWEELLYSSPMNRVIGDSFAYFEDGNTKVQFGGDSIGKSLLVIMEEKNLSNIKRMHYHIFDENPLLRYYVCDVLLGTSWRKEFFEKSIQELTKAYLEKILITN